MRHIHRVIILAVGLAFLMLGSVAFSQDKVPGPVVLKGAPMGGVKFDHASHTKAGAKCEDCHHASKPQKALTAKQQKCTDCHTKTATAPMKTATKGAFHDGLAKAGTCVDCHKKAAKGPAKCQDCHKKENT